MTKGASCRTRVIKHLSKTYTTIEEVEEALQIDYVLDMNEFTNEAFSQHSTPTRKDISACANGVGGLLSPMFDQSPNQKLSTSTTGDMVKEFILPNCDDDKENEMASTMLSVQTVGN